MRIFFFWIFSIFCNLIPKLHILQTPAQIGLKYSNAVLKALPKDQRPPQELEEVLHRGLYLLVYFICAINQALHSYVCWRLAICVYVTLSPLCGSALQYSVPSPLNHPQDCHQVNYCPPRDQIRPIKYRPRGLVQMSQLKARCIPGWTSNCKCVEFN